MSAMIPPPDLIRTWLFGPGAEPDAHRAMADCGADALILDLEDFTPPAQRDRARGLLPEALDAWRARARTCVVRINLLQQGGEIDLDAALPAQPDYIALPMAETAAQVRDLAAAIDVREQRLGIETGRTAILPICETALGVVDVRRLAAASPRVRCALLGAEDLAADLCAERGPDAVELEHARRRFVLECRAARIEPIDAPWTFDSAAGAAREARHARRLGYRCKSLVRPDHAAALNAVFTPDADELDRARTIVDAFDAARERGEERALVDGQWVEVPTWRNARRVVERARRLRRRDGGEPAT